MTTNNLRSRPSISDAVILMAGAGSRLHSAEKKTAKPLIPLLGRPLISYILKALARARIKTIYAVVGFKSDMIMSQLPPFVPAGTEVRFIHNQDWKKQNGISVLAAADHVRGPFLLTMSDHLFDQSILDLILRDAVFDRLNLAVDRKIQSIFDLEDAMKVETRGDRILAIGKNLETYDAIDTGLFVCPPEFFDYLERAKQNGDCSLADGVRLMASAGQARAVDIGDAWWQDIDTPEMFAAAEAKLGAGLGQRDSAKN